MKEWKGGKKKHQEKTRKEKEKEKAFNLFHITVLRWFQQNAEYFSVSQGPAFVHRAVRVAGSQQTLIAPKPKAATFKQGHSSSHRKGNGLWPWSLITPPPCCNVQGHQGSPVINRLRHTCMFVDRIQVEAGGSRDERRGERRVVRG